MPSAVVAVGWNRLGITADAVELRRMVTGLARRQLLEVELRRGCRDTVVGEDLLQVAKQTNTREMSYRACFEEPYPTPTIDLAGMVSALAQNATIHKATLANGCLGPTDPTEMAVDGPLISLQLEDCLFLPGGGLGCLAGRLFSLSVGDCRGTEEALANFHHVLCLPRLEILEIDLCGCMETTSYLCAALVKALATGKQFSKVDVSFPWPADPPRGVEDLFDALQVHAGNIRTLNLL